MERLRFRQAPLLAAAVWFAVGEVLARFAWRPGIVFLVAVGMMLGLTAWALRGSLRVALLPVAGLWVVVGMWCGEMRPVPSPQTGLLLYADNLSREVRGHVVRLRALPPRVDAGEPDSEGWRGDQDEQAAAVGALQVDVAVDGVEYLTPDVSEMVPMEGGVRATIIADEAAGAPSTSLRGKEDGSRDLVVEVGCRSCDAGMSWRGRCGCGSRSGTGTRGRGNMRTTSWARV